MKMSKKATPEEDRKFFRDNRLVNTGCDKVPGRRQAGCTVMTLKRLTAAVLAGKADGWMVCQSDETGHVTEIVCPYCATGVKHPGGTVH